MKAGVLKAHLEWVQKIHGDEGTEKVLSSLDPAVRTQIERSLATTWLAFKDIVAVDRRISELWGKRVLDDLGFYSADINLKGAYRAHVKQDIHEYFRRSSVLHHLFQDFGSVRYEPKGPNSGSMVHTDYEYFSPVLCATAIGFFKGVLAAHGAKAPKVAESSCLTRGESSCTFELSWN